MNECGFTSSLLENSRTVTGLVGLSGFDESWDVDGGAEASGSFISIILDDQTHISCIVNDVFA